MTLEEYEKLLEEKRKALQALKTDAAARKVDTSEFEKMKAISSKKENNEIFAKLVITFLPTFSLLSTFFRLYTSDNNC